ncbi:MAG: hypothetical protein ACXVBW_11505 [Bdellovibrionota bacterium]
MLEILQDRFSDGLVMKLGTPEPKVLVDCFKKSPAICLSRSCERGKY